MRIYRIAQVIDYQNLSLSPDSEIDSDTEDKIEQATDIFFRSKLRPNRSKDVTDLALSNGRVVGSVISEWRIDGNNAVFSFDIAVDPKFRNLKIGTNLIERAIAAFLRDKYDYEDMGLKAIMRLEAINIKLSKFLIKNYGFKVEQELPDRVFLIRE